MDEQGKHVLLAIASIDEKSAKELVHNLKELGAPIASYEVRFYKAHVEDYLMTNPLTDVLLVSEELELNKGYTTREFERIAENNPKLRIIPILTDSQKGKPYVKELLNVNIFDALFNTDAELSKVADLIARGRSRKEARYYYEVDNIDEAQDNKADINACLRSMRMSKNKVATAIHILGRVTKEEFATVISKLPKETIDILLKSGEEELLPYLKTEEKVGKLSGILSKITKKNSDKKESHNKEEVSKEDTSYPSEKKREHIKKSITPPVDFTVDMSEVMMKEEDKAVHIEKAQRDERHSKEDEPIVEIESPEKKEPKKNPKVELKAKEEAKAEIESKAEEQQKTDENSAVKVEKEEVKKPPIKEPPKVEKKQSTRKPLVEEPKAEIELPLKEPQKYNKKPQVEVNLARDLGYVENTSYTADKNTEHGKGSNVEQAAVQQDDNSSSEKHGLLGMLQTDKDLTRKVDKKPKVVGVEIRKSILHKRGRKNLVGTSTVFVTAIRSGCGSTHIADTLATYMAGSGSTCLITPKIEDEERLPKNLTIYETEDISSVPEAFSQHENIVMDAGAYSELSNNNLLECKRANIKVMVCWGGSANMKKLASFVEKEGDAAEDWIYVFNNVPDNQIKEVKKLMNYYTCCFMPVYSIDAMTNEVTFICKEILHK